MEEITERMTDTDCLTTVVDTIREIAGVSNLDPAQDFYDGGVTSVQALPLLMELETRFNVTIPDDRFIAARTINDLCAVITDIRNG